VREIDEAYRRIVEECADFLDDPICEPIRRVLGE